MQRGLARAWQVQVKELRSSVGWVLQLRAVQMTCPVSLVPVLLVLGYAEPQGMGMQWKRMQEWQVRQR